MKAFPNRNIDIDRFRWNTETCTKCVCVCVFFRPFAIWFVLILPYKVTWDSWSEYSYRQMNHNQRFIWCSTWKKRTPTRNQVEQMVLAQLRWEIYRILARKNIDLHNKIYLLNVIIASCLKCTHIFRFDE